MAVHSLGDGVPGPVGLGQVAELPQLVLVPVHVALIRRAAQHVVHNDRHLGPGDGVVRPEAPVGIPADPAVGAGVGDVRIVPGVPGHVGEPRLPVDLQVGEAHRDGHELRPGDGVVRPEGPVRIALHHAQGGQRVHRLGVPRVGGHVGEGHGDGHVLVQKQGVEHLGHLGAGHAPVRPEGVVGVAGQVGVVVVGVQPAGHAGVVGIGQDPLPHGVQVGPALGHAELVPGGVVVAGAVLLGVPAHELIALPVGQPAHVRVVPDLHGPLVVGLIEGLVIPEIGVVVQGVVAVVIPAALGCVRLFGLFGLFRFRLLDLAPYQGEGGEVTIHRVSLHREVDAVFVSLYLNSFHRAGSNLRTQFRLAIGIAVLPVETGKVQEVKLRALIGSGGIGPVNGDLLARTDPGVAVAGVYQVQIFELILPVFYAVILSFSLLNQHLLPVAHAQQIVEQQGNGPLYAGEPGVFSIGVEVCAVGHNGNYRDALPICGSQRLRHNCCYISIFGELVGIHYLSDQIVSRLDLRHGADSQNAVRKLHGIAVDGQIFNVGKPGLRRRY